MKIKYNRTTGSNYQMVKITKQGFINATRNSGGIQSVIAKRLGVGRSTITEYIHRHAWTNKHIFQAEEEINDLAETKLIENIDKGELRAIEFRLKTKAKNRGYADTSDTQRQLTTEEITPLMIETKIKKVLDVIGGEDQNQN